MKFLIDAIKINLYQTRTNMSSLGCNIIYPRNF